MRANRIALKLIILFLLGSQYCNSQTAGSAQKEGDAPDCKFNQTVLGKNAYLFEPGMNMKEVQTLLDTLYKRQSGKKSEFSNSRVALFFKPGTYHLDVKVGYYMQVYGLGNSPDEVVIVGAVRSNSTSKSKNVLSNFWRSAENLTVVPTVDSANIWGVSQAAPLRRIHIKGNLQLHDGGYASGGFMADCKIDGTVFSGQQQQWFSRNTDWNKWVGGNWNMMFMGVPTAPEGRWPEKPYTVIQETPLVREKPYLVSDGKRYHIKIPDIRQNSTGPSWESKPMDLKAVDLQEFYLAHAGTDNAESINDALQKGKNILFTPGIYAIDKSLRVNRPGTILLGIGMATLQSANGNSILEISDVDGITVCGLLFDAGIMPSETLVRVGESNSVQNHGKNPTFIYDVYFRVGGPLEGSTSSCLIINSRNVYVDNCWLWRADHGNGVGWNKNKSANGLIVNGDNVTIYGLFNEHFQEYQTLWNGNNGKVYFYQSEMPYDPPTTESWSHKGIQGYASYKVSDKVTSHEAWGVGVYCVFNHAPMKVDDAIETPEALEQNIHHTITFWLNGNKESCIRHIINNKGESVHTANRKATLD
ncbi:MAG: coagulation factor 5/8 type domain-containing protein [Bacteroidota bacterium]|nr:coagulation factor 5/8 type domain-containing protein [Bacteroidota bacterium]